MPRLGYTEQDLATMLKRNPVVTVEGGVVRHVSARGEGNNLLIPGSRQKANHLRKAEDEPIRHGAGLNPAPPPTSPYRSKWEINFANKCELDLRAGLNLASIWILCCCQRDGLWYTSL